LLERRELLDGTSFLQVIAEAGASELLGLSGDEIKVAQGLIGLFADNPPDKIMQRIDRLEDVIHRGFQDLGSLINTQVQRVIDNERTLANQDAIAHAVTAERDLYDYKLTGDNIYRAFAANESSLATAFLEQQTDPFYISGLICAGNARIDVFRALKPDWVHDPILVGEVNELINSLAGMINTVRQSVDSAHTVAPGSEHEYDPSFTDYFYSHSDKGEEINRFLYYTAPEKYPGHRKYYTRGGAEGAAKQDRLVGIAQELAFLSIPNFELIQNTWKDLTVTLVPAAPTQATAGAPFDLTVTALDGNGNVDTNYRGTVQLTSSDPSGQLPPPYTFTAGDNGVHRFTAGAAFVTAGSQSIIASDTVSKTNGSAAVMVTPAPANHFALATPAQVTTGVLFDLTATALDPYGNTDTNYQGTVHFSTSDTDPGVVLPADYTFQATDQGVQTFAGAFTLVTTGVQTVTATDTANAALSGNAPVSVTAGPVPPPGGASKLGGHPSLREVDALAVTVAVEPATLVVETVPLDAGAVDRVFPSTGQDAHCLADRLRHDIALAWANEGLWERVAEEIAAIV